MKSKKLKRILGTSWESLFNNLIQTVWEKGEFIEEIVLSEKAVFPLSVDGAGKKKNSVSVYVSDFGTHKVRVDRRFKGDKMFFYGQS